MFLLDGSPPKPWVGNRNFDSSYLVNFDRSQAIVFLLKLHVAQGEQWNPSCLKRGSGAKFLVFLVPQRF